MNYEQIVTRYLDLRSDDDLVGVFVGLSGRQIRRMLPADASPDTRKELFAKFNGWATVVLSHARGVTVRVHRKELASVLIEGPKPAVVEATKTIETAARREETELDYCPADATIRVGRDAMVIEY